MQLSVPDRFSDSPTDNPYWNENVWFSVSIPERRMHGIIQYCFRPNMGLQIGGPVFWDQTGVSQYDCLHYNWSHLQAIPKGAEKYNMKLRNSLAVKILEPMKRYKIDYNLDGFEMDLVWEAVGPHHQMNSSDPTQNAAAAFHFEQPGRMKGVIRRHGEEYKVDCWSMRDGSSGPYDAEFKISGGYFWGIGGEGKSFLSLCMGDVREAGCVGGYIMKDGVPADIVSGTRKVLEYGKHAPSKVSFEATDAMGRSIKAIGSIDPGLILTAYTDHTVIWALMSWECEGETYWGDNQEFYPSESFRRMARGEIKLEDRR